MEGKESRNHPSPEVARVEHLTMTIQARDENIVPKELMDNPEYLLIGEIVAVHGIKGGLRIRCNESDLSKFMNITEIVPALQDILPALRVSRTVATKNVLVVFLDEIDTIESAEALIHYYAFGKRSEISQLQNEEWWVRDLIGLDVYSTEGEMIGTICDVISTGSDLLEVRSIDPNRKGTFYIPFAKEIVPNVDIARRRVEVKLIPGLLDL
jgi:16S rRNA processing protein RimM